MASLRFSDRAGRLEVTEIYLEVLDEGALSTDALRALPLGRIEASVNEHFAESVRARLGTPGPDLKTAARHFATRFGRHHRDGELVLVRDHWIHDMYWSQFDDTGVMRAPLPALKPLEPVDDNELEELRDAAFAAAVLSVPPERPYGEEFYRALAGAYAGLCQWTRAPAAAIADANGVELTTAHRWVREARKRGFLAPARHGKAG